MLFNWRKTQSTILLVGLALSLTVPARAQNSAGNAQRVAPVIFLDSTKEQDGLVGPVRRVQTETAKLVTGAGSLTEGQRQLLEVTTYNLKGERTDNASYPVGGSSGKEAYKYDEKGNIIEMTLHADDGSILSKETYEYQIDDVGNWTKMVTSLVVFEDGKLRYEPVEVTYRIITYYYDQKIAKMLDARSASSLSDSTIAAGSKSGTSNPITEPKKPSVSVPAPAVSPDPVTDSSQATPTRLEAEKTSSRLDSERVAEKTTPRLDEEKTTPRLEPQKTPTPLDADKTSARLESEKTPTRLEPEKTSAAPVGAQAKNPTGSEESQATRMEVSLSAGIAAAKTPPPEPEPSAKPIASPPIARKAALDLYKIGRQRFDEGNLAGAVDAYQQSIQLEPSSAQVYLSLGHAYLRLSKSRDAVKAFKEAVRLNPDMEEAHYGLGLEYFRMHNMKDAAESFRKAISVRPDMAKAHYGLALAYQEMEKPDLLLQEYRVLQTLDAGLAKKLADTFPAFNLPCGGRRCH